MIRLVKVLAALAAFAGFACASPVLAANCTSIATGNWNAQTTWGAAGTGCVGAAAGGIPGASDAVTIGVATTVTVSANAAAASIAMSAANPTNGLSFPGAFTLTVTGALTMAGGNGSASSSTITLNTGTINAASVALNSGDGTGTIGISSGTLNVTGNIAIDAGVSPRIASLTVGTGTVNAASITFTGTAADMQFTSTGNSTVNLTGSFGNGGTLTTSNTGTFNFIGSGAQTIGTYITYNNVTVNNAASASVFSSTATINGTLTVTAGKLTTAGALTVGGVTTVANGATLSNASGTLTMKSAAAISGTLTAAAPLAANSTTTINGTLALTAAAATGTFIGMVTVNSGGTWNNTGNSTGTFEGGITNNGNTFAGGTGQQTFSINSQALAGSSAINIQGVAITGAITVTNNNTSAVTIPGDIIGSVAGSAWTQGPNSTLNCGGPTGCSLSSITLTASATGNTVNYDSTLPPRNVILPTGSPPAYYNLVLGGTGAHTMPAAAMTILNNLTFNGTGSNATALGALTIGGTLTIGAGTTFNGGTGFTHTISGSVSNSGTFTPGTSSYTIGGTFTNSASGIFTGSSGSLTVSGSLVNSAAAPSKFSLGSGPTTVSGSFTNSGTFVAGAGTFSLAGNFTNNGSYTSGSGAMIFNGTTAQTFGGTAGATDTFTLVTLNNPNGLTLIGGATSGTTHNMTVGTPSPVAGTCPNAATVPATVLTLTSGQVTTGINTLTIGNGSAIAGAGGLNFIVGYLAKPIIIGGNETSVFEVGTGTSYAPLTFFFSCVTSTATVTVSSVGQDTPQIMTSTIDSYQSLNRYWTMSVVAAHSAWFTSSLSNTLTFTYVAGDIDPPPTAAGSFAVEIYSASGWSAAITPNSAGATSTTLAISNIPASALSATSAEFQIGDVGASIPPPSSFNAFDSTTAPGAATGFIQTKIAGAAIPTSTVNGSIDVVALGSTGAVLTNFVGTVSVSLLGNTVLGVPLAANNCPTSSTTLATVSANIATNGRVTITSPSLPAIPDVWRDVRVSITYAPTGTVACSTDNFAIRPYTFAVSATDNDWMTAGTTGRTLNNGGSSGGVVHRAGQPFTITATAQNYVGATTSQYTAPQYSGSPTLVAGSPACILPVSNPPTTVCTLGTLANLEAPAILPMPAPSSGVSTLVTNYSEAGAISLQFEDQTFASVDTSDGSSYTIPQLNGTSTPSPITVGRFVPDSFTVVTSGTAPAFATFGTNDSQCNALIPSPRRSFTYIGQPFSYVSTPSALLPQVTVTAINATGGTTTNYQGALWKIVPTTTTGVTCLPAVSPLSCAITATGSATNNGSVTETFTSVGGQVFDSSQVAMSIPTVTPGNGSTILFGTGTIVANAADSLAFLRSLSPPVAPFGANISLNLIVSDASEMSVAGNGTIVTSNNSGTGATFAAMAFDSGNQFYYGRMHASNANGSVLLPLLVSMQTQYYNGFGFVQNIADQCTTITTANIGFGNFAPPGTTLTAAAVNPISLATKTFVNGGNTLKLSAPGAANSGAMDMVINLESTSSPVSCVATGTNPTGANMVFLHDIQSCSTPNYTQDPTAHITFGVNNINQKSIYLRENY